ncbi:restriction endonuclease subunit S [Ferribacterium limneticum]|uniref:restriction endonuclease subunit S n=1 Tax=Ferribacterium limneticum TaxID=76259 RepID=UPI001CFA7894|nr:restriction endonuclease subunit S [Ferribacterium limneticum]UCV28613.1 restriction endonuclease subunit S [Ferribacterium limneticum]UCV32530.1 restriction endonuclease subunit S [Ferribacterium limneticum]
MSELAFAPLAHFADVVMGQSPGADLCNTDERGLPFLQGCAEFGARHPHSDIYCSPPLRVAKAGSVLISVRAPVGTMNYADQDYCIGRGLGAFKAKSGVSNTVFLKHAVELNAAYLHRRSQGSTFAAVSIDDVKTVPIPVFKSEKQEKIANILTGIDSAIEKTDALIAKYQQIKAGLMHDLFTRGVLPNGQLRPPREQAPELYQETAFGWIPREWQYELLDKLALRGSGHTPNKNFPEYWNGGIKWVSLADSHRLDQLYISDTEFQISHKGIQNSSAVLHPAGIVVLSRDAGVGKSAITTEPMAVSQHFMCWKCDQKIDNHFLYYWLQFNKRTFENIAMGSTILTIGLPYFKKMKIACPVDLVEQRKIAAKMKANDTRLFTLQDELSKLKQQKAGLMHDLLTGKVAVKFADATLAV